MSQLIDIIETNFGLNRTQTRRDFIKHIDIFITCLNCVINEDLYERATGRFMHPSQRFGLQFIEQITSYSNEVIFFRNFREALYAFLCRLKSYPIPINPREARFAAQWSKSSGTWIMKEDFDTSEEENETVSTTSQPPQENIQECSEEAAEQVVE